MRRFPCVLSGLAVLLLASGCLAPTATPMEAVADVDDASVDDAGKPTKGEKDAGVGDKDDSGLGEKDAGIGDKDDGGGPTDDAASGEDAGSGSTADAGGGGGMMGTPDAGNEMNACFACAQQRCSLQVNACEHAAGCAEEWQCDLACFESAGDHFLSGSRCVASCTKDPVSTAKLLAAATCAFLACPVECLHTFTACGGDPDMGRPMEPPTSGPGCHGFAGAASH